jgi:hypothetical protein
VDQTRRGCSPPRRSEPTFLTSRPQACGHAPRRTRVRTTRRNINICERKVTVWIRSSPTVRGVPRPIANRPTTTAVRNDKKLVGSHDEPCQRFCETQNGHGGPNQPRQIGTRGGNFAGRREFRIRNLIGLEASWVTAEVSLDTILVNYH